MPRPLQCPHCGASEATLLQDNIYQCKSCGTIYDYNDINPEPQTTIQPVATVLDEKVPQEIPGKIVRSVFVGVVLMIIGFAAVFIFSLKNKQKSSSPDAKSIFKDYNETNSSFTVVNTSAGLLVWTLSRRNADGLTEVSFFLNRVEPVENKIIKSVQIGNTITWKQSFEEAYKVGQLKTIGSVCFLINGDDLLGYDVNTQEKVMNREVLSRKFPELKAGIAKVDDVYDTDGFELTTTDGYKYYYLPVSDKLLTEKEYDNKSKTDQEEVNKVEYCFTDGKRQQLYKINRRTGKIFYSRISPGTLNDIIKDDGGWYKKTYKINSIEEFIPGEIYFNGNVLYHDDDKTVIAYQAAMGEKVPIIVKCLGTDKKVLWSKSGSETEPFKPMLKATNTENKVHGNQLAIIQPYQVAICLNSINGNILWTFKPY